MAICTFLHTNVKQRRPEFLPSLALGTSPGPPGDLRAGSVRLAVFHPRSFARIPWNCYRRGLKIGSFRLFCENRPRKDVISQKYICIYHTFCKELILTASLSFSIFPLKDNHIFLESILSFLPQDSMSFRRHRFFL
jgi:hypothetical protein